MSVKPVQGKQYLANRLGFMQAVSRKESSSDLSQPDSYEGNQIAKVIINPIGYIGYFQFGEDALIDLGYYKPRKNNTDKSRKNNWIGQWTGKEGVYRQSDFLNSRQIQFNAFNSWMDLLCKRLRNRNVNEFYGKIIDGFEVTESGCIAAAHLRGDGFVRDYLKGLGNGKDANGTSVSDYMSLFREYDLESCCNRKIYIDVKDGLEPVEGKKVTVESEYKAGKYYSKIGKIQNTFTTDKNGKIPVIVRHPGAEITIIVDEKSTKIIQEANKKQSYTIDLKGSITTTAPLEEPSDPQPKPQPNKSPQDLRNEQGNHENEDASKIKDVTFNIVMIEADTKKPITNLRFSVIYKGKPKEKRTDDLGIVPNIVASVGQDIEISMKGEDNMLQPIYTFKVNEGLEGQDIQVPLPVHNFTIKVLNHKSECVKNTNFIINYRGKPFSKKTDNNGSFKVRMLVGFVYGFALANGKELLKSRCIQTTTTYKITLNDVAYNSSQDKLNSNQPIQEAPSNEQASPSNPSSEPSQNNTHTEENGNPLTVVTNKSLSSTTTRYHIYYTGVIKRENSDATGHAEFIYYDESGNSHNLGKSAYIIAPKRKSGNGVIPGNVFLIDQRKHTSYSSESFHYTWTIVSKNKRYYLNGVTMAAVLGALMTYNNEDFRGSGFSGRTGKSLGGSKTHRNGEAGDFRYIGFNGAHTKGAVHTSYKTFDMKANTKLVKIFKKFGYTDLITGTKAKYGVAKVPGTRYVDDHHHHLHIGKHNNVVENI